MSIPLPTKIYQKVIITKNSSDLTPYLSDGYVIKSIIAQCVSSGSSCATVGGFCFLLEK